MPTASEVPAGVGGTLNFTLCVAQNFTAARRCFTWRSQTSRTIPAVMRNTVLYLRVLSPFSGTGIFLAQFQALCYHQCKAVMRLEYIALALFVLLLASGLLFGILRRKKSEKRRIRYDPRGFDHNRIHRNGTKYDDEGFDYAGFNAAGFNRQGYTAWGRDEKGRYDRLHDTTSPAEEGFYPPDAYPIAVTDHARLRLQERLGIKDPAQMEGAAAAAYRYGKSKRQIKKTSASLVDEIEQKHDNSAVLIYKNFIYVFSMENVLITVYRNDKIPL
jgi:hypothetical protein